MPGSLLPPLLSRPPPQPRSPPASAPLPALLPAFRPDRGFVSLSSRSSLLLSAPLCLLFAFSVSRFSLSDAFFPLSSLPCLFSLSGLEISIDFFLVFARLIHFMSPIPHFQSLHLQEEILGVLRWLSRLRIQRGHCCGVGSIPGTSACRGHSQKIEKERKEKKYMCFLTYAVFISDLVGEKVSCPVMRLG